MAKSSKFKLTNDRFEQGTGDTFTLSGNTIIQGGLNFASGYVPTGDTSVPTKGYIDQNGVDSLTFQNGITRTGDNVELGGLSTNDIIFNNGFSAINNSLVEENSSLLGENIINIKSVTENSILVLSTNFIGFNSSNSIDDLTIFNINQNTSGYTGQISGGSNSIRDGFFTNNKIYVLLANADVFIIDLSTFEISLFLQSGEDLGNGNIYLTVGNHINYFFDFNTFLEGLTISNNNGTILVLGFDKTVQFNSANATLNGENLPASSIIDVRIFTFDSLSIFIGISTSNNGFYILDFNNNNVSLLNSNGLSNNLIFNGNPQLISNSLLFINGDDTGLSFGTSDGYFYSFSLFNSELNINTITPSQLPNQDNLEIRDSKYVNGEGYYFLQRGGYVGKVEILGGLLNSDFGNYLIINNKNIFSNSTIVSGRLEKFNNDIYMGVGGVDNGLYKFNIQSINILSNSNGFQYPSTYTNPNPDNLITRRVLSGQTINDFTSYSANTENIAGADLVFSIDQNKLDKTNTIIGVNNTATEGNVVGDNNLLREVRSTSIGDNNIINTLDGFAVGNNTTIGHDPLATVTPASNSFSSLEIQQTGDFRKFFNYTVESAFIYYFNTDTGENERYSNNAYTTTYNSNTNKTTINFSATQNLPIGADLTTLKVKAESSGKWSTSLGFGRLGRKLRSTGLGSHNISHADSAGSDPLRGADGLFNVVLGGRNSGTPKNSESVAVIGLTNFLAAEGVNNTVYLPSLRIGRGSGLVQNGSSSDFTLVYDSATGEVKKVPSTPIVNPNNNLGATPTIDLSSGDVIIRTMNTNVTDLKFNNGVLYKDYKFYVKVDSTGGYDFEYDYRQIETQSGIELIMPSDPNAKHLYQVSLQENGKYFVTPIYNIEPIARTYNDAVGGTSVTVTGYPVTDSVTA